MVKRDVVQIITKGTRLDENMDAKSNNYMGSIYENANSFVLSYVDISTGEINTTVIEKDNEKIEQRISKLNIKELIVNEETDRILIDNLRRIHNILVTIIDEFLEDENYSYIYSNIDDEETYFLVYGAAGNGGCW